MLFQEDFQEDVLAVLTYINEFTKAVDIRELQISSAEVMEVCLKMRGPFPHIDGLEQASIFKKVAYFVAFFVSVGPIKSEFPADAIPGFKGHSYNANAVVAFDIAIACLEGAKIKASDGDREVNKKIFISDHSYADIICALSQKNVSIETHYHLLAVLFEQLTYKTNPQCEYGYDDGVPVSYYPADHFSPDDMTGI